MPSWGTSLSWCPHGTVATHNGQFSWNWPSGYAGAQAGLVKSATGDLDGDGSVDIVAIFHCDVSNPGNRMAVAFRRGEDGSIRTMGVVSGDVHQIQDVGVDADGSVDLQVSNQTDSDESAVLKQIQQQRTYRWTGTGFDQAGGPSTFTISRPELTATVSDLTFDAPVNGKRTGKLTVSVHNGGTTGVSDASVVYELNLGQTVTPPCAPVVPGIPSSGRCQLPSIAPGGTGTLTLTLTSDDAWVAPYKGMAMDQVGGMFIQIRVGGLALTTQPPLGRLVIK